MDSGIAALAEWSLKKAAMAASERGRKSEMARLKSKITSCDWLAISARPPPAAVAWSSHTTTHRLLLDRRLVRSLTSTGTSSACATLSLDLVQHCTGQSALQL